MRAYDKGDLLMRKIVGDRVPVRAVAVELMAAQARESLFVSSRPSTVRDFRRSRMIAARRGGDRARYRRRAGFHPSNLSVEKKLIRKAWTSALFSLNIVERYRVAALFDDTICELTNGWAARDDMVVMIADRVAEAYECATGEKLEDDLVEEVFVRCIRDFYLSRSDCSKIARGLGVEDYSGFWYAVLEKMEQASAG